MAKKQNDTVARTIFMLIPLLGLACIVASFLFAVRDNHLSLATIVGLVVGHLLCLTLFIKAEAGNLRYYLHVFIYSALVLGICVTGYLIVNQHKHQLDLTKENLYSLNPASTAFLRKLDKDVNIVFFTDRPEVFRQIEDMYTNETKKLKFEYINPVKDRLKTTDRARALGITKPGMNELVLKSGPKTKRMSVTELVAGNYENVMTNAIIEVTAPGTMKVYFTTGHGELPYEGQQGRPRRGEQRPETVQIFRKFLGDRGMETAQLDLLAKGAVPNDATAVVIAGPKGDLNEKEAAALRQYLDKGGRLLALVGPSIEQQRSEPYTQLTAFLNSYGVNLPNDIILDLLSAQIADPAQPLVGFMDPNHPITKDIANANIRAALTLVRPVTTTAVEDNRIQATELIKSSDQSFLWPVAEALTGQRPVAPPQNAQKAQPMGVAVGMTDPPQMPGQRAIPKPKSYRLVVYGTPDLVADQTLANQQLFQIMMVNTMNWLTERDEALNIPPRKLPGTPIILDAGQQRLIFVFAVILLPELLFFGGIGYSLRRRGK